MTRWQMTVARVAVQLGLNLNWIFDPVHIFRLWLRKGGSR